MRFFRHYLSLPTALLAGFECALFLLAMVLIGIAGNFDNRNFEGIGHLELWQAVLVAMSYTAFSSAMGLYNRDALLDFRMFIGRLLLTSQLVLIPTVLAVGFINAAGGVPFGWYLGVLSLAIGTYFSIVLIVRVIVFWTVDHPLFKRRILVFGAGPLADAVEGFVRGEGSAHLRCVGRTARRGSEKHGAVTIGNLALRLHPDASPVSLQELVETTRAEEIVVATNERRGLPLDELLECRLRGVRITDYAKFWEREVGTIDIDHIGKGTLAFEDGFRVNFGRRLVKRTLDILVGLVFLILTAPVCALVALLIKMDSAGPVFFWQERVGLDGKSFWICKFRSMRVDAEADGVARWASERDPRITRVGKIIRRIRLDEFPQVFNVLIGDMSFIGPRPERPVFVEQLAKEIPFYDVRHRVQPGITGWAQVSYKYGSSREDAKRKLGYDLYYVKNGDLLLDIAILLQSVRVVLFAHGGR
jgi:sugar transferase (PEP-CTERM system associated)